ncbi:MAG TPA: VIT domain-containing protein [Polyangiaceae bacterium]|nr:VIT domain-containing protein [Polyangiaceae bacterium]
MPTPTDDESPASPQPEPTASDDKRSEPSSKVSEPSAKEAATSSRESRWLLGGVLGLLALFGALAVKRAPSTLGANGGPARVERIHSVAGAVVSACAPSGSPCQKLSEGGSIPRGSRVKTDFSSEADLLLADGTALRLERASEVALSSDGERGATLLRGGVVVEVARQKAALTLALPHGSLSTVYGKLAARAARDFTTVEIVRGAAHVEDRAGHKDSARAGELVRLSDAGLQVSPTPLLGSALAFESSAGDSPGKDAPPTGLGQLSARKPGARDELQGAVKLVSHAVRVRIAGALARTEIEETFQNGSDQTLEGIYRFPIPPDAQLERLALDVDGKWVDGAFVDRDRAAAIWRGAIVNAAPQAPKPAEEIVWVPGPWRDPALLEWQRGGRFELRIFPIPRHGERRVILSYTELVRPSAGTRRYTYPLAHAGSTGAAVERFEIDVQVRGHDTKFGVHPSGYELADRSSAEVSELSYSARNLVPSGDLGIEYALPNPDTEARAWAYLPAENEPSQRSAATSAKPNGPSADSSAYVAIALRPRLPAAADNARRTLAVVVDTSRSMLGESHERAKRLAARIVRELDPDDRVHVLSCDSDCRESPETIEPGAQGEAATRRFLDSIAPDGASDPTRAVRLAYDALTELGERAGRIVYIGDGAPTVGPIRPAHIEAEVARALPADRARLTVVGVGAEADSQSLSALARGGGGVVVRYAPGESVEKAAFAALGASYGRALRDVEVTLPEGLYAIAPTRLDSIPAGGEQLVVARMTGTRLSGDVVLRGRVGSAPFERRYPLTLSASSQAASAFVPRLYAALRIADLERDGSADAKRDALALSTRFSVASRYTSLLVLESEAMFHAFGLERSQTAPSWTGEEAAESTTAQVDDKADAEDQDALSGPALDQPRERKKAELNAYDSAAEMGVEGRSAGGLGATAAAPMKPAPAPASPAARSAAKASRSEPDAFPGDARANAGPLEFERPSPPPPPRQRRMVPMRRVWERTADIDVSRIVPKAASFEAIAEAERKSLLEPDRREPLRKLYTLLALGSDLGRAEAVVQRWSSRDALDVEALTARADLAAQRGEREEAIRLLGSVIDARPAEVAAQRRLERLERWSGKPALACRHLVAAAELRSADATLVSDAVRCSRATGDAVAERELLAPLNDSQRRAVDARLASAPSDDSVLKGDLRVEASWQGGEDLDLALIDSDGQRMSFLGAPTRAVISARDVTARDREGLSVRGAKPGEYLVEIVRSRAGGPPISGELTVNAAGATRRVPFRLTGSRERVALIRLRMVSHLEPLDGVIARPF